MMEVQGAAVFNNMDDAKTELHCQLCESDRKSYYGVTDLAILDECKAPVCCLVR